MKLTVKVFLSCLCAMVLVLTGCESGGAVTETDVPPQGEASSASVVESPPQSLSEPPSSEPPEPEISNEWELDIPENHGMDSAVLEKLHEAAALTEIRSIVIAKGGYIIDEYYNDDYDETTVFGLASCSKSFTGALIGIAIEQGFISGVDVQIAEFLPQIATESNKQRILLKHLLTHTSGIEWYEWSGGTSFRELNRSENWVEHVLGKSMVAAPGDYFSYTTGGSHLLGAVLENATGQSLLEFGRENLFEPMGMDSVAWRADPQGVTDGGNGISMTTRDAAKFGQLYLNGGKWHGKQLIPAEWVAESTKQQDAGPGGRTGAYGYQWWMRAFGKGQYDTFYAMGHGGQFIFIVPELELVTVITSRFSDTYAPWPYFIDYVLEAYTG